MTSSGEPQVLPSVNAYCASDKPCRLRLTDPFQCFDPLARSSRAVAGKSKPSKRKPSPLRLTRGLDTRIIYCGDNNDVLRQIPDKSVDLIYIDPPFHSGRDHEIIWGEEWEKRAFADRHESIAAYRDYMLPRCSQMARVLKPTGSFYYHCDWHASHYIKVMLDGVFGEQNFQNEVIWKRSSAHSSARKYGPVHDTILFYTGGGRHTWHREYQPYDESYLEAFFEMKDPDGRRWKRMDLTGDGVRRGESGTTWRDVNVTAKGRHWAIPRSAVKLYGLQSTGTLPRLDELDSLGAIHWPKKADGVPRLKQYADQMPGVPLQTIWDDIPPLHNLSKERVGYPTQKPRALLDRIIKASSNRGEVVLDAFCGCGTTLESAEMLDRQWIGIDFSPTACKVMADRLEARCQIKWNEALWKADRGFVVRGIPITQSQLWDMDPFDFQNWAIIAIDGYPNKKRVGDMGIDGRLYPASAILNTGKGASGKQLEFTLDMYYPIQTKQKDNAGRPDIDLFETAMRRIDATRGYFVAFGYTQGAIREIERFERVEGRTIVAMTVDEILREQENERSRKLAR